MEWATNDDEKTRRMSKGSSTYYVVPLRWMMEVTSQRFWDQYFWSRSPTLLWIPKRLGVRVVWSDEDLAWWRLSQSSEGRVPADHVRVVRRNWVSEIASLNDVPARSSPGPSASQSRAKTVTKCKRSVDVHDPEAESDRAGKRKRR